MFAVSKFLVVVCEAMQARGPQIKRIEGDRLSCRFTPDLRVLLSYVHLQ